MYVSSGGGGLTRGPLAATGSGAAAGGTLAFTGFPLVGVTIVALVAIIVGLVLLRVAMVRRAATSEPSE